MADTCVCRALHVVCKPSHALKSKLHRNFGKLYASQGRFDDALKELAQDVYHSSLEMGPEHIDTAGGYYHMATIFFQQVVCVHTAVVLAPASLTPPPALHCCRTRLTTRLPSMTRWWTRGTSSLLECAMARRTLLALVKLRYKRYSSSITVQPARGSLILCGAGLYG